MAENHIPMRPPEQVMRLARMGSFHQSRLSFMRVLLRRMAAENWQITQTDWQVNEAGVGHAVYQAKTPLRVYSLVVFAHDLPDDLRSDRVIAEAWDVTFTLFDGGANGRGHYAVIAKCSLSGGRASLPPRNRVIAGKSFPTSVGSRLGKAGERRTTRRG